MPRFTTLAFALLVACAPKSGGQIRPDDPAVAPATTPGPPKADDPDEQRSDVDADAPCTKEECGPAMGMPNTPCSDGKTVAGPVCKRNAHGTCAYQVIQCPEA